MPPSRGSSSAARRHFIDMGEQMNGGGTAAVSDGGGAISAISYGDRRTRLRTTSAMAF
jgi:hypothetical protein